MASGGEFRCRSIVHSCRLFQLLLLECSCERAIVLRVATLRAGAELSAVSVVRVEDMVRGWGHANPHHGGLVVGRGRPLLLECILTN